MLLGLNGATTMKANLVTDIQVAAQAGYDYLEIWTEKLDDFLQHNSIYKLKEMLDESNLKPLSVNSLDDFTFQPEAKFQEIQQRCAVLCERAMHLNCHCLVVCPSPLPSVEVTREAVKRETIEKLQILLRTSKGYGVDLAFEFLGEPIYSVKDLAFCNEIVEEINDPSLGMVIDVFHFYIGGSTLDSIKRVDPKKLSIVHLNDAEDLPKDSLKDKHRLLPGEGILPLRDILSEIKMIGYQGPYSIELFRPEYWEWDHSRLAIEAKERMATILTSLD